jgi:hypothetical protein
MSLRNNKSLHGTEPMTKPYKIIYESPEGSIQAEAESFNALKGAVSFKLLSVLSVESLFDGLSIEEAATTALSILDKSRNRHRRYTGSTKISQAGFDIDIITCYLQNMNHRETVAWFKENRSFSTSKSAVHRYYAALRCAGIYPVIRTRSKPVKGKD